MTILFNNPSRTFNEYLFVPNQKERNHSVNDVSLKAPLVKLKIGERPSLVLNIPFVSAIMQAASGPELAIALARCGGLAFIFQSQPIKEQVKMVKQVKNFKAGFVVSDSNLRSDNTLADAQDLCARTGHSTMPVTDDGTSSGRFLGILTEHDWKFEDNLNLPVARSMTKKEEVVYGKVGISLKEANALLKKHRKSCLPILDKDGNLRSLVFWKDLIDHFNNPNELLDAQKRLMVGAGINTWDYKERVPALVGAGVDVLCIDSSNGYTDWQKDALQWIKKEFGDSVKVGGGNVVDGRSFRFLADAGADFVKIGIGGGSICITREQKGIGMGQATAVMEAAKARNEYFKEAGVYLPLCSDGSIVHPHHIAFALAMGADFVMMGGWFARFKEAPGKLIYEGGNYYKEYWGEGTNKARNLSRYAEVGDKQGVLAFEEGVEGRVPFAGELKDGIKDAVAKIKATMCDCGALNIRELQKKAVLRLASPSAIAEGSASVIAKEKNVFSGR